MSWATSYINDLKAGKTVVFRPRGNSMKGRVASGALCTVAPLSQEIDVDDVVLCKVNGRQYLHLVLAKKKDQYLIGNNIGGVNDWIGLNSIYGKLIKIEN